MPRRRHFAKRTHCFVGEERTDSARDAKSFHAGLEPFTFEATCSANASAPRFVPTNMIACLLLARVSRAMSTAGVPVISVIGMVLGDNGSRMKSRDLTLFKEPSQIMTTLLSP